MAPSGAILQWQRPNCSDRTAATEALESWNPPRSAPEELHSKAGNPEELHPKNCTRKQETPKKLHSKAGNREETALESRKTTKKLHSKAGNSEN